MSTLSSAAGAANATASASVTDWGRTVTRSPILTPAFVRVSPSTRISLSSIPVPPGHTFTTVSVSPPMIAVSPERIPNCDIVAGGTRAIPRVASRFSASRTVISIVSALMSTGSGTRGFTLSLRLPTCEQSERIN